MILLLQIVFWLSAFLVLHTYALFPLILRLCSRKVTQNQQVWQPEELPFISIIIAAHNEDKVIEEKLASIYLTTLPESGFEILIGSDCSTDQTNALVEKYAKQHSNIRFFPFTVRQGKSGVINQLMHEAKGEIAVFTDANVFFEKDTLYQLVKHFKNSSIGQVGGNIINTNLKKTGISVPEKNYLELEKRIKYDEGKCWGAMIGAFGGSYALRTELYKPVPGHFLMDDFYISMGVFEQGHTAIFEPDARCFEDVSDKLSEEFRRKVRISAGNYQNLFAYKHLLWKSSPGFVFSYISHKILRWKTPFFLIMMLLSSLYLGQYVQLYHHLFLIQVAIFVFLPLDFLLKTLGINLAALRLITHFISMNLALLAGFFKFLAGIQTSAWKPTERNQ